MLKSLFKTKRVLTLELNVNDENGREVLHFPQFKKWYQTTWKYCWYKHPQIHLPEYFYNKAAAEHFLKTSIDQKTGLVGGVYTLSLTNPAESSLSLDNKRIVIDMDRHYDAYCPQFRNPKTGIWYNLCRSKNDFFTADFCREISAKIFCASNNPCFLTNRLFIITSDTIRTWYLMPVNKNQRYMSRPILVRDVEKYLK